MPKSVLVNKQMALSASYALGAKNIN